MSIQVPQSERWTPPTSQGTARPPLAKANEGETGDGVEQESDFLHSTLWDSDGFSFGDILDMVNPLQHIPVISNIYRHLTHDDIGHGPRMVGGALFGGLLGNAISGFVTSAVNVLVKEATHKDIGEHVLAALHLEDEPAPQEATTQTATPLQEGAEQGGSEGTAPVSAPSESSTKAAVKASIKGQGASPVPARDVASAEVARASYLSHRTLQEAIDYYDTNTGSSRPGGFSVTT